jgi:hypothetical protein
LGEVVAFVLNAPTLDDRLLASVSPWTRDRSIDDFESELGQVSTLQKADEVAWAQDQPITLSVHLVPSRCSLRWTVIIGLAGLSMTVLL